MMAKYKVAKKVSIESKLGDFLKKEGLLKEVIKEIRRSGSWDEVDNDFTLRCLSESFGWRESRRGYDFWENVRDKFEQEKRN
jgi:hypothetical protein